MKDIEDGSIDTSSPSAPHPCDTARLLHPHRRPTVPMTREEVRTRLVEALEAVLVAPFLGE